MGPVGQMEADPTWKALCVDSAERKTYNRATAQLAKKALGMDSIKTIHTYNCAITQLAMAYSTKMTWMDCMRAIAQLRRK